jgi:bacterioferritin-associated ferredoxin
MYVCLCHGIRDRDLRQAIDAGKCCFEDLQSCTGVATSCGKCEPLARQMLDRARDESVGGAAAAC